jgi:hypothetical protein
MGSAGSVVSRACPRSWVGVLAVVLVGAFLANAAAVASAHPPPLNPIAVARYLAAQRAGFGSPARAAALGAQAETRARALRSRPIPAAPGVPSFSGAWSALGPTPVTNSFYGEKNTGRVDSAAVVQSGANAGEIFEGTAGGGVWSSTDNGATWVSHTDQVATGLAIGALAIDPTNPSIIYAGTGEANSCGDCFYGGGVLKSTDGGATWTVENPEGVFTGVDFVSIVVDPNNDSKLYAGTTHGFYESTDGGSTWAQPTGSGTFASPTYGIALDPTSNPTTVYIATESVGVQKSTDGGTNFSTLGGGLPAGANFGVTALGIGTSTGSHPTANQDLYAAVRLNGATDPNGGDLSMYKSTDSGSTWTRLTIPAYTNQLYAYGEGSSDQAWYDNTLAVDPANPAHVLAAGIAMVETTDGGSTWSNVNGGGFFSVEHNVLHPDFHALTFTASGNAIIGCDGGVYEYNPTKPGPSGVSNLNTDQNTTQFYEDLGVYNNGAEVLGGLQDNGTVLYTGAASWPDKLSGDGGYSAINPLDGTQGFAEADGSLYEETGGVVGAISPPGGVNGNFVPPMTIVPNSGTPESPTVYYGGADLWVTNNPTSGPPTWTQLTSVVAGVSAIAVAPSNPAVLYVGFDNGMLLVSTNATSATPTFTDISPGVEQWITHIDVNPTTPGSIAVSFTAGGFNAQYSQVPPMVETGSVTLTGTPSATYTNITGNLPSGVASDSVVSDGGALVVATDVGVFSTSAPNGASTSWSAVGTGLPNVEVLGLSVDANGDLYAATHGRGVWKLVVGSKTAQTITFTSTAPGSATVGGSTYTVAATASSGLAVSFTIDAASSSVCSISGATVSFIATGTCTIDANQAGSSNYDAAPQVQQPFAVGKGSQTIAFTSSAPESATVGGSTYTVKATGGASGEPVTFSSGTLSVCSISGATVSFIATGTCTIDANQAGNSNYNAAPQAQQPFAVGKGSQTIAFTSIAPGSATVGGATYTVAATGGASGLAVSFTVDAASNSVCSISGTTVSFIGVGTCTIDANQAGNSNYNAAPQAQQSFAVGKGSQTIAFSSSAPSSATVGGATYTVAATASSGLAVSFTIDAASSSVCSISGATVSFIGVGTCTVDANQAGNANYNAAAQAQQSFAVSAAPVLIPTLTPTLVPDSGFSFSGNPTVNQKTGAITFTMSVGDPGTFSWLLTFQNGKFGVFASRKTRCKAGFVTLKGKCRPANVLFGKGSQAVASAGAVSFTVKPSASALRALRNALKRKKGLPVTVTLTFQSSRGGSPVSHTQSVTVGLKRKK